MSQPSFTDFSVANFSGSFEQDLVPNLILQSLGFFSSDFSDTPIINFDVITRDREAVLAPVQRYGSAFETSARNKASLHAIEMPFYMQLNEISASDYQGKRKQGTTEPLTAYDVLADYLIKHKTRAELTEEAVLAKALFSNTVSATHTQNPVIDMQTEFGLTQQTGDLSLLSATAKLDLELDDQVHSVIRKNLGSYVSYLENIYCFCGNRAFSLVKGHPSVREAFLSGAISPALNPLINYAEQLPAVQSFTFNNITFLCVTDPLYNIGTNDMFFVPKMNKQAGIYKVMYGPASRHADLAERGGARLWQYSVKEPRFANITAVAEQTLLPLCYLPDVVVKVVAPTA